MRSILGDLDWSQPCICRVSFKQRIFIFFQCEEEKYKTDLLIYLYLNNMENKRYVLILALAVVISTAGVSYDRVMLDDPKALCLDGSQGAYYISKGDQTKVVLFFEGGGWCGDADLPSTIENCYQRSKTDLGSSTNYPSTVVETFGIFSDDQENYFTNWTKIQLRYCDGSGHQGSRSDPILYKGAQLFFRGQDITLAQFESINQRLGIFKGTVSNLVISGQSAGGLAAFQWTNYLQDRVSSSTELRSIPDSGVFLDYPNINTKTNTYRIQLQNLLKLSNEQTGTPIPSCNVQNKDNLWRCMFTQNIIKYIQTPLFAAQSLYDSWSLYFIVGIRCITGDKSLETCSAADRKVIEDYHQNTMEVLFQIGGRNKNGIWAPICINHCYLTNWYYSSNDYRIPAGSEMSLIQTIGDWMEGKDENPRHIDFGEWPDNRPCSGLTF